MEQEFTHFDEHGRARMVDVGNKEATERTAAASGRVFVNEETFRLIKSGGIKKGDVLSVAQIAGIMGAKKTLELIPMCHPIMTEGIRCSLSADETNHSILVTSEVRIHGKTGVEMEALTAVSTACLTVYDMCKSVQRDIEIGEIRLLSKTGGIHGDFCRPLS